VSGWNTNTSSSNTEIDVVLVSVSLSAVDSNTSPGCRSPLLALPTVMFVVT
jgi:hypothetical protein